MLNPEKEDQGLSKLEITEVCCIEVAAEELNVTTFTRSAGAMVPRSSLTTFFASENVVSFFCPVSRRTTRSFTTEVATIYLKVV